MSESAECCPEFNPEPWNKVTHQWKDKPFIIDTIPQFMHMPLPWMYRKVLARMWDKAKHLGIAPDLRDFLLLAYDPSPWKSELYLAVTKDSPDGRVTTVVHSKSPWSPTGGLVAPNRDLWILECSTTNAVRVRRIGPAGQVKVFD
jgi:hypothetical protein